MREHLFGRLQTSPPAENEEDFALNSTRAQLPAWLLSTVAHLALLLLLVLVFQGSVISGIRSEQQATGSIVLSRPSGNQSKEYFQQASAAPAESSDAAPQNPLPEAAELAANEIPQLALPDLNGIGNVGAELVQGTQSAPHSRSNLPSSASDAAILSDDVIRNAAPGPAGPPAAVQLFGTHSVGHSFLFLIDRSKSMGTAGIGALAAAEKALLAQLQQLQPNHRFQIITYNQRPSYLSSKHALLIADDHHKKLAAKFLKTIIATGATKHDSAILTALNRQPDVIFLLTDGGDPVLNEGQLRRIAVRNSGRTTIHTLHFGWGAKQEGSEYLMVLARQNKGLYKYVNLSH
jgi:hypothetical protein